MTSHHLIESSRPGARWVRRVRVFAGSLALVTAVLAFLAAPVFALEIGATSTTSTSSTATSTTSTTSTSSAETSASSTSSAEAGYSQTPEKPTEEGYKQEPAKPETKKAVAPEKEEVAPKEEVVAPHHEVAPKEEVVAPHHEVAPESKEAVPAKAKELPFTGFDFRWLVGIGVALLLAGGLSLKLLARRERRSSGR